MRILVLTHEYPPIGGGGGRVAQDICRGLTERGHELRVLTAQCNQSIKTISEESIKVIRLKSGRRQAFRADLRAMFGFVWASFFEGLKQIKTWKPDVIHVHFAVPAGVSAYWLHLFTKVPYIITAHLGDVPGGVPEKTNRWFRWIYPFTPLIWRKAAGIAAVSEFTKDLAQKSYDVNIEVVENGVDLKGLDPGIISINNPPRIVFAGRFAPQKNMAQLLTVLVSITDLDWKCDLIGDGPLFNEIKSEITSHNLDDRITLTGWLTPEQVIEHYRHSDILLMTSLSEGLPVVGVQSMAMGLALVLSRVGGCVNLVEEGRNGYLLNPEDTAEFEEALRKLLLNPDRLLSFRLASRQLADRFSLDRSVTKYENLLQKAVKHSR